MMRANRKRMFSPTAYTFLPLRGKADVQGSGDKDLFQVGSPYMFEVVKIDVLVCCLEAKLS